MANQETPVLSVRNLKQHFKSGWGKNKLVVRAVDGVSFDIYKGEVFSLVGESGCGKTTTGRSIIKLYEPTDGEVYFLGKRITAGYESLKREVKRVRREAKKEILRIKEKGDNDKEAIERIEKARDERIQALKLEIKERKLDYAGKRAVSNIDTLKEQLDNFEAEAREELDALKAEKGEDSDEVAVLVKEQNTKRNQLKKQIKAGKVDPQKEEKQIMKRMQMIFQDPIASLNPRMIVKEIIAEGLRIAGERDDKVLNRRVNEMLETVGLLPEHASRYPHEFSGGQRQRIGIARALAVSPEFIIADEPISALDVSIQAQVMNLLNDLRQEFQITIMFIAHDLSVVKYFSDRIGVMYYGNLVELAPKDELFKNPLHPYTKSLLSAVPAPDPHFERQRTRTAYDPRMHDYSEELPKLHEIKKGHFIMANTAELEEYKKELT